MGGGTPWPGQIPGQDEGMGYCRVPPARTGWGTPLAASRGKTSLFVRIFILCPLQISVSGVNFRTWENRG